MAVQRACTSPTSVRFTRPAPDFDGGIGRMAQALDCGSSHESSILSSRPNWAVRIRGLPTACTREMRVQVSHRPPEFRLVNSTEECWSEKPVDTVQFRGEPPDRGVA